MGRVISPTRMLIWVVAVILLLALFGAATMANAAEGSQMKLCVNPSGLTRVPGANETCRPSEKLVTWGGSGSQDVPGSQGGTLIVVDSLGNTIGPLLEPDAVVLTAGGNRFLVFVGPAGLRNNSGFSLYYDQTNCSGVRRIDAPIIPVLFPVLRVSGPIGYYAGSNAGTYSPLSRQDYDFSGGLVQCFTPPSPLSPRLLAPATTVTLPGFAPPLSIK